MKKLIPIIFLFISFIASYAQHITTDVRVDQQHDSRYMTCNILMVISSDDGCLFIFDAVTPPHSNSWIMMSSSTIVKMHSSGKSLKLSSWGYVDDDDFELSRFLEMDEKYALPSDSRTILFMLFPPIPEGVEVVDISTNTGQRNDLVWHGIHFINSGPSNVDEVLSDDEDEDEDEDGGDWHKKSESGSPYGSSKDAGQVAYGGGNLFSSDDDDDFDAAGEGSGFAISRDGLVATCQHVIDGARQIRVRGINGDFDKTYEAKVVASDANNDIAILRISDASFTRLEEIPYSVAENYADVGENVYALGYPLRSVMGDEIKLTNGIISSQSGYQGDLTNYQISVPVQPGNSGGPLFNQKGDLVGVVCARLQVENAAYAVKVPYLRTLANSLDKPAAMPNRSLLVGMPLSAQVKAIKKFIYIIEVR